MSDVKALWAELISIRAALAAIESRVNNDDGGDFTSGSLLPPMQDTQGSLPEYKSFMVYFVSQTSGPDVTWKAGISSGFISTDTTDWIELPGTPTGAEYEFIDGGIFWVRRIYPIRAADGTVGEGAWTYGYGTPPEQDETSRVVRLARTEYNDAEQPVAIYEEPGNVFVVDIVKCQEATGAP